MKNKITYIFAAAAVLSFASCEELPDYQKTIDAAPVLAYVNTGEDNWHSTTLTHRPSGTTGEFSDEFAINCNSGNHGNTTISLVYDASLVEDYNAANGTSYKVLPEENILLENASLALEAGAWITEESAKVTLTGDFTTLTERQYLCAFRIESSGMDTSEEMGAYYLEVLTEVSRIRPISSSDELVGYKPANRDIWTADCTDYKQLFDGNTSAWSGGVTFDDGQVITVDMKEVNHVTALDVAGYVSFSGIEYSVDGQTWEQAGSLIPGEYLDNYSGFTVAFDGYLEARYIKFTCNSSGTSWFGNRLAEFDIYKIDGTDAEAPVIYAYCGTNNVLTGGTITHHNIAGTSGSASASFGVMTSVASSSGFTVEVAVDNSLVAEYNSLHGTSYAAVDEALVSLTGSPLTIGAEMTESEDEVQVSLTGDLSGLTNTNGYIIPLHLSTSDGTVVSESNGTVYVVVNVAFSDAKLMSNITEADIPGEKVPVEEKATWTVLACDAGGVHPDGNAETYKNLFDGDSETYVRTWGGPVDFTIDLGKTCNMSGMAIISSTWSGTYSPNSVLIEYSTDTPDALTTMDETPSKTDGTISVSGTSAFIGFYEPIQVRYLRVCATYGSNMGTGEFELYVQE